MHAILIDINVVSLLLDWQKRLRILKIAWKTFSSLSKHLFPRVAAAVCSKNL